MASIKYVSQTELLNSNLLQWASFISNIIEILDNYLSDVDSLQSLIDDNLSSIDGLRNYINAIEERVTLLLDRVAEIESQPVEIPTPTYINLSSSSVDVININNDMKERPSYVNVFSNCPTVYMFATKVADGITVNGRDLDLTQEPIYSFSGSICGDKLTIKCSNQSKTDIVCLAFNSTGNVEDPMEAILEIKVKYGVYDRTDAIRTNNIDLASLRGKFILAANALNGSDLSKLTQNRLSASQSVSSATLQASNKQISEMTQQLLGGVSSSGAIIKKKNSLNSNE